MSEERRKINIAIVEDNGVARLNLRNHLVEIGFHDIGCYSHGRELKVALKRKKYDIILMDFHLGMNKNGVEVIQELQKDQLLKPSTSLIFITSDRMPLIIGQIVDIHPDALVLKPYTIRNLEKTLGTTIKLNTYLKPVLKHMDEGEFDEALAQLQSMIDHNLMPKHRMSMIKLKARLLLKIKEYAQATAIYRDVLDGSDKIIWARWGLIQSLYLGGDIETSEKMLDDMLGTHLTKDKACEWLARININREKYDAAQEYMNQIKEGELSLPAARLKAYLYQVQDDMDSAIGLLEKKRESNRNIRERFAELSFDLARCYITLAESMNPNEREQPLQVARFLIGSATRKGAEDEVDLQRNYMNALVAIMEGDFDKAKEVLNQEGMEELGSADIPTLSDAVSAWNGIGEATKASEILFELEQRIGSIPDENEKTISTLMVVKNEEALGDKKSRAIEFNKKGLALYNDNNFNQATDYFYQAYLLFQDEPAFSLNLLQCMVEDKKGKHKEVNSLKLKNFLTKQKLSSGNKQRLKEIVDKMQQQKDVHFIADKPAPVAETDLDNT